MSSTIEQFGKYLLLEKVAAGGMAEVFLAKSAGAGGVNKFVAIKRILPQFSGHQEFIDMFKEEAKIAVNLNHGNVVSIFDFGIEKDSFFLVMEYVAGKNLRQIINEIKKINKTFSIEQVVYMIKEVAAGLDHAHRCVDSATGRPLNITHRDMSPQNVMVSFEGEIKVIDFGIAKAESQLETTKAGTLKGKFGYMSPEQAEGFPIDPRTDIFALGIVLWELLANDRLFTANNEAAILRKIRDCQIPSIRKINPAVPPELERIVNKALAKDKNLRYQTAANFHRDLNRFLNTQYPDFSPHDFSVFIKDSFHQHYIEQRNKLVEFAKAQALDDKTKLTLTKTDPMQVDHPLFQKMEEAQQVSRPTSKAEKTEERLDIDTQSQAKVSLDGLRENITSAKSQILKAQISKQISQVNREKTYTGVIPNPSGRPKISSPSHVPKNNSSLEQITNIITKSVIGVALIFAGYWSFKSTLNPIIDKYVKSKPEEAPEQRDIASKQSAKLSVFSEPSNGEIFLNGVKVGVTPSIISVPLNQDFKLKVIKPGFDEFKDDNMHVKNPVQTLNVKLDALSSQGTINILVVNSTGNEIITINNRIISQRLPIKDLVVDANKDLSIIVKDRTTNLGDTITIRLRPGENRPLEFVLGKKIF